MNTRRVRAGQPCTPKLTGEQIAKELHERYFGKAEKPLPVEMHEPSLMSKLRQFYRNIKVSR